jgi:hypothetical protein
MSIIPNESDTGPVKSDTGPVKSDIGPVSIKKQFLTYLEEKKEMIQIEADKCCSKSWIGNTSCGMDALIQFLKNTLETFNDFKGFKKPEKIIKKGDSVNDEMVQWFKFEMDNYKLIYDACFTPEQKIKFKSSNKVNNKLDGLSGSLLIVLGLALAGTVLYLSYGGGILVYGMAPDLFIGVPQGLSILSNAEYETHLIDVLNKGGMRGGKKQSNQNTVITLSQADVDRLIKDAEENGGEVLGNLENVNQLASSLDDKALNEVKDRLSNQTSPETLEEVNMNIIKELAKKTVNNIFSTAISNVANRTLTKGGRRKNKGRTKRKSKNKRKNKSKTKRK